MAWCRKLSISTLQEGPCANRYEVRFGVPVLRNWPPLNPAVVLTIDSNRSGVDYRIYESPNDVQNRYKALTTHLREWSKNSLGILTA